MEEISDLVNSNLDTNNVYTSLRVLKLYVAYIFMGQMSYSFFRCMGALSRDHVIANTAGCAGLVWILVFSGFILSRGMLPIQLLMFLVYRVSTQLVQRNYQIPLCFLNFSGCE